MLHSARKVCLVALCFLAAAEFGYAAPPVSFQITFDKQLSAQPFSGRVYVMFFRNAVQRPPGGPNWFDPQPMFAKDVKDWKPEAALPFAEGLLAFPTPLEQVGKGTVYAMALMDFNRGDKSFAAANGNGFSKAVKVEIDPAKPQVVALRIDQIYQSEPPRETERVKYLEVESKLLTKFHGTPVKMRAGVVLPKSYATDTKRRFPVLYEIPGFGGTHTGAAFAGGREPVAGIEVLHVVLDPSCRWGHHVFADSATNGPCGRALTEELIPAIEERFRGIGTPQSRILTGHSSGGWSSLWLQVTYPDFFAGTWSTAPDPVCFRDFQRIDIYADKANVFADPKGDLRPLARRNGKPILFFKAFSDMEVVMGHGGQLQSFEGVFSPRDADGMPRKLWDRRTGAVDPEVAKAWEAYDIALVLERDWARLAPKLSGKLHVYMGGEDTFYLDGATVLLQATLRKLGSDAKVEIFPGKDHGTLMSRDLRDRIAREMAATLKKI